MFAGKKSAQIREILINESAWEEMTCLFALSLFDSQGQQLPLNRPTDRWISLYRGRTTLNFVAKYRATGRQVTGGAANAQAWFSLTYQ